MAVYLIFKYGKRFRCAPSFNNLHFFFDLTYFREVRQKYRNILVRFLVQMKTSKSNSEIKWPLSLLSSKREHFNLEMISEKQKGLKLALWTLDRVIPPCSCDTDLHCIVCCSIYIFYIFCCLAWHASLCISLDHGYVLCYVIEDG